MLGDTDSRRHVKAPPGFMGRARVICYTTIDARHRFTGKTRQIVAGEVMGPMAGLAICQHPGDTAYYLFGCDADWNNITDTLASDLGRSEGSGRMGV